MAFLIVMLPICFADSITTDENGNIIYTEYDNLYREYNSLNQLYRIYNGTNATDGILLQEYIHHPMEERIWIKKNYNSSGDVYETFYYLSKEFVVKVNDSGEFNYTYVYHDGNLIAQVNPDNTTYYILGDHIGSSQVVTDSNGNVIENNSYTPYGELIEGGNSIDRLYEGKEYDSVVGDYDFGFRKYLSYIRIWGQPDSLLPNVYDPQQLNRYSFERNNPYKYVDEDGHSLEAVIIIILATIIAAAISMFYISHDIGHDAKPIPITKKDAENNDQTQNQQQNVNTETVISSNDKSTTISDSADLTYDVDPDKIEINIENNIDIEIDKENFEIDPQDQKKIRQPPGTTITNPPEEKDEKQEEDGNIKSNSENSMSQHSQIKIFNNAYGASFGSSFNN